MKSAELSHASNSNAGYIYVLLKTVFKFSYKYQEVSC